MEEPVAASSPVGLGPRPALTASWRLFRSRLGTNLALGAAVGLSLLSVCCGLGLVTTPWFICELSALQLATATGRPIVRGPAFLKASWLLFWAVIMVSAVFAITLLGAGSSGSAFSLHSVDAVLKSGTVPALLGSAVAWVLITPLLYAPLIVLEQLASPALALAESARLMVSAGLGSSARLGLAVYVVQHTPIALAALLVSLDPGRAALWLLLVAPLTCLSMPIGQGMLVSAYVQVRGCAGAAPAPPQPLAPEVRRWVRVWAALIVLPIAALVLLELSLSRPSRIAPGSAPTGDELVSIAPTERPDTIELPAPASALTLEISTRQVSVVASDGGGVGDLPLAAADPIAHVRVVRVRDTFAIELLQGGRSYLTEIDRAGVRRDDGLRARLRDRSHPWQWLYFLVTLLLTIVLSVRVLYDFGRLRCFAQPAAAAEAQARALRRARLWALLLAPLGLGCLAMVIIALFAA